MRRGGAWPSGKAADFGSAIVGSNPAAPAIVSRSHRVKPRRCFTHLDPIPTAARTRGSDDPVHLGQGLPPQAIVLAAGKGTRMKSSLPKMLHRVAGKPMLTRVLDTLRAAGFPHPVCVVGHGAEQIEAEIGPRCRYVLQEEQQGTGHAARVGLDALPPATRTLVLTHADEPLIPPHVYADMLDLYERTEAAVILLTTRVTDTRGFGRVIRDAQGQPQALVQEADLTPEQRGIDEVNLGAYILDAPYLRSILPTLHPHPPKGEYYLTDVVARARRDGRRVEALEVAGGESMMGVNDLVHLEAATREIYRQTNRRLMREGVTIIDSTSTFIAEEVRIAPETVIHPFCILDGATTIGRGCQIGPGARITDTQIGHRCRVLDSTLTGVTLDDGVSVGPYARLRDGAHVGPDGYIGNYAEIKNARIGPRFRMHHFSYVGDADVGENVNIGAGTVTVNYDGLTKHRTVIGDNAFIGSGTMLRAPVVIGAGAKTGAGAVVTHDVAPGTVVAGVPARPLPPRPTQEEREH